MDELNFGNMDDLGGFGEGEDAFSEVEKELIKLAQEDMGINKIVSGELDENDLRMFLASNTLNAIDSTDNMMRYVQTNKPALALLSNLCSQMNFGHIGLVRVMMAMHGQQAQMLKYMDEHNTYLAVLVKRMEDHVESSSANRSVGGSEQNEESSN